MKNWLSLFLFLVCGLLYSAFTANAQASAAHLQNNSVEIQHSQIGEVHILVFQNLLTIPEENYQRFFNRMQLVYPAIIKVKHLENLNQIQLEFTLSLPETVVLSQILQKFSILQYSISSHD